MDTLLIDGVDITPYIAYGGIKWSRYDTDGPNAGRAESGLMWRDRKATKIRLDITFHPLRESELSIVLNAILPEYVQVTYDDPMYGQRTMTAYSNNNPATVAIKTTQGEWLYTDITAPLIER